MYLEYYTHDKTKQMMDEARQQRLARIARMARTDPQKTTLSHFSIPALAHRLAGLRARLTLAPTSNAVAMQMDPAECYICA
jgi:hypothetical protein